MSRLRETDLYPPVKAFLEGQGYDVKGEVSDCAVVGVRDEDELVVVELKTAFNLPLILQKDHYGWFERVERGVYALTPQGAEALVAYADVVAQLQSGETC